VITCALKYVIDPAKIGAFERLARRWMELVELLASGVSLPPRNRARRGRRCGKS